MLRESFRDVALSFLSSYFGRRLPVQWLSGFSAVFALRLWVVDGSEGTKYEESQSRL